uniref:Uncharacterized protein n=1 Tax=Aureoumbra lagunensis TaxID=44058 RepID=A0A7S3NIV6_9STRA|mmetsp:Transcript_16956/g.25506  ORF Transcript_16956/g.25506 Transcript_16956/m.25506 type:complete len:533 (-) Transcript_16956:610-2208(-)
MTTCPRACHSPPISCSNLYTRFCPISPSSSLHTTPFIVHNISGINTVLYLLLFFIVLIVEDLLFVLNFLCFFEKSARSVLLLPKYMMSDDELNLDDNISACSALLDGRLPRWEALEGDILGISLEEDEIELFEEKPKRKRKYDQSVKEIYGHVNVRGDIEVDGGLYGRLATATRRQDWAEWFECEENVEMGGGTVVRLKSPEQKLTLNTHGDGPILVVSERAAVAAGVPSVPEEAEKGRLVCFMGQVPVRCHPPIKVGEKLVPSGLNDGMAIGLTSYLRNNSVKSKQQDRMLEQDPIGVAMEENLTTSKKDQVLALVRWDHAVRREVAFLVDQEELRIHGRCEKCFIALLAAISFTLIILHLITLLFLITYFIVSAPLAPTSRVNNFRRDGIYDSMSSACFLWTIEFVFIVIFFLHFSSRRIRQSINIACFWIGHAFFAALFLVVMLSKNSNERKNGKHNRNPLLGASLGLIIIIMTLYDLVYQSTLLSMLHSFSDWYLSSFCSSLSSFFSSSRIKANNKSPIFQKDEHEEC